MSLRIHGSGIGSPLNLHLIHQIGFVLESSSLWCYLKTPNARIRSNVQYHNAFITKVSEWGWKLLPVIREEYRSTVYENRTRFVFVLESRAYRDLNPQFKLLSKVSVAISRRFPTLSISISSSAIRSNFQTFISRFRFCSRNIIQWYTSQSLS